jgi:hypothetical protein
MFHDIVLSKKFFPVNTCCRHKCAGQNGRASTQPRRDFPDPSKVVWFPAGIAVTCAFYVPRDKITPMDAGGLLAIPVRAVVSVAF